jgi:hypothetical protein
MRQPHGCGIKKLRELGHIESEMTLRILKTSISNLEASARACGYRGRYLPSGQLVFVHDGVLFGVDFDLDHLNPRGVTIPLLDDVADDGPIVSENHSLINSFKLRSHRPSEFERFVNYAIRPGIPIAYCSSHVRVLI